MTRRPHDEGAEKPAKGGSLDFLEKVARLMRGGRALVKKTGENQRKERGLGGEFRFCKESVTAWHKKRAKPRQSEKEGATHASVGGTGKGKASFRRYNQESLLHRD